MDLSPSKINAYLLFKLPSAFFAGVRVISISNDNCLTTVKHRWINQNPFRSIFWAIQGMAAELSTGALVMGRIKSSHDNISMLVISNKGEFLKKARGRIIFTCTDGKLVEEAIKNATASGEGQVILMKSEGKDEVGDTVSLFEFEWSIKVKKIKIP